MIIDEEPPIQIVYFYWKWLNGLLWKFEFDYMYDDQRVW